MNVNLRRIFLAIIASLFICTTAFTQDEDFNKLVEKIYAGDVEGLKEVINSGIKVDARNEASGVTALILSSSFRDNLDIIKYLVSAGADINAKDNTNKTALGWASGTSFESTKFLLSKGAEPNIVAIDGTTPFIQAVFGVFGGDSFETLDLLVEHGADVNLTIMNDQSNGYSALSYASRNGKPELVEYLLSKGANVNHATSEGDTPLMIAAEEGDLLAVNILLKAGADKALKNNAGITALDLATKEGKADVISVLK